MINSDWIRTMRNRQGLKSFELAERLQVSAARVSVLEKDEIRGAVTLKMMDRVARAMGCRFEYRFVPQAGADKTRQAEKPRYRLVIDDSALKNKSND